MAWHVWGTDAGPEGTLPTVEEYEDDEERASGFVPATPCKAKPMNAALHEATAVTAALANLLAPTLDYSNDIEGLSPSATEALQAIFANYFGNMIVDVTKVGPRLLFTKANGTHITIDL